MDAIDHGAALSAILVTFVAYGLGRAGLLPRPQYASIFLLVIVVCSLLLVAVAVAIAVAVAVL